MPSSRHRSLLGSDPYATSLGVELIRSSEATVELAMIVRPEHVDADGRLTPGVAFSLADCAMSLAGNAEHRAVAITAGLRPLAAAQLGDRIHARLERSGSAGDRTVWEATVGRSDGTIVARFTGTTLRVADRS